MAFFNLTEKQQKAHFFPSVFLLKSSLQPQKCELFCSYSLLGSSYSRTRLVHTDLASIFNITTALNARKPHNF